MKKHWVLEKENPRLREKLVKSLQISPVTAQVLINRGVKSEAEAGIFLKSGLFDIPSPYLLKGMDKAVHRIKKAVESKEKIAIYGDYDVDGVTATALLYTFLKSLGASVIYYNPDRLTEGYGVNIQAVNKLKGEGVSLIISGDCGITAFNEIEEAKKLDIDFIVTDHHKPPEKLPEAVSVLNPLQPGCPYPGKEIAGVGVIFNLAIALRRVLRDAGFFKNDEPNLGDYLDLVALGTVADCAPLTNVNRIFVKEGTARMLKPKRIGMRALKEASGIKEDVSSFDIGFKLGPRVNASGRLQSAAVAVELLISDDPERAKGLADVLNQENSRRQNIEENILRDAVSQVESSPEFLKSKSLVLASSEWHPGVIGIVASRIVERYRKPAVLIAIQENGIGKGSGRSVEGVNLYAALSECREFFEQFGGHELAAGISIQQGNIDGFRKSFEKAIGSRDGSFIDTLKIDAVLNLDDLTESLVAELDLLSPFGIGNPEPVFLERAAEVVSRKILKDKHLSLKVKRGGKVFSAIWFNFRSNGVGRSDEPAALPDLIDMVFIPEFNVWNGKKEIRLRVKDIDYD